MIILIIIIIIVIVISIIYLLQEKEMFKNNWNNMIDGIVYINLENREDRKKLILEELNKIEIDMNKVNKVSGVFIPKNGHKGCVQSHILALNIAKMNNWKQVLIFEDDMKLIISPDEFNDKIDMVLEYFKTSNIKWDVIMLATGNSKNINTDNEDIVRIISATTSSGYIVNSHYYDTLLTLFNESNNNMTKDKWSGGSNWEPYALDQQWSKLQAKDNWYAFKKDIIKQRNIKSSIMSNK